MSVNALARRLPDGIEVTPLLAELKLHYEDRGVNLVQAGGSWAFRSARDLSNLLNREIAVARKLGRATIETLAIIAYHQPVTRAEIEEIRGVAVSRGTIDQLLELEWIKLGRRKQTPGRPITFVGTDQFLDHFGLENARDLPGLKELRAAGLLENRPVPGVEGLLPSDDEGDQQENLFEHNVSVIEETLDDLD